MNDSYGVPGSEKLSPAQRLVVNLQRDLHKAVGLYSIGIRSETVLRILAEGKKAYQAIGAMLPVPGNLSAEEWVRVLDQLVRDQDQGTPLP